MTISTAIKAAQAGLKVGGKFVVKHLPTILTAVGTAGVIFGTIQAARKAPEAKAEFEQAKEKWESLPEDARSKPDLVWRYVKVGARYYGIVCLVVGGSIVCFWMANHVNLKRIAAATAGMAYYKKYAEDLEKGVKEEGGDGALSKIKDKLNANSVKNAPPPTDFNTQDINTMIGECMTWDPVRRHWIISSASKITRARDWAVEELYRQAKEGEPWCFVPYADVIERCGYHDDGPNIRGDAGVCLGFGMELPVDLSPEGLREAAEETVGMSWTTCLYDGSVPALAIKFENPPDYDKNIY